MSLTSPVRPMADSTTTAQAQHGGPRPGPRPHPGPAASSSSSAWECLLTSELHAQVLASNKYPWLAASSSSAGTTAAAAAGELLAES